MSAATTMDQQYPGLQPPKDLWYHLSRTTQARAQSSIKRFYKYFAIPGIGQLAGGLPAPEYFPFDTLEARVALPDRFKPTPNDPIEKPPKNATSKTATASSSATLPPSSHLTVPKLSPQPNNDRTREIDLTTALQYGTAQGYPPLYEFLLQFTRENLHPNIPYAGGPDICLTVGNTDGFSKCLQLLTNEWSALHDPVSERECLLVEEYAYMNAIQASEPRGMLTVPVAMDSEGMLANGVGGLRDVLQNWDYSKGKRPRIMYTVTMGQNPTGSVLGVERRKELYGLCREYDVIIVEDDPYWYLQYPSSTSTSSTSINNNNTTTTTQDTESSAPEGGDDNTTLPITQLTGHPKKSSGYPFLDSLVPSYLTLDTDGRVLRLDTFSKTIAPGCRLGWITAQPAFIERLLRIAETSTQQPSGFVQSMVAELIMGTQGKADSGKGGGKDGKGWDTSGWVRWLEGLRGEYQRRMESMTRIFDQGAELVVDIPHSLPSLIGDTISEEDAWTVVNKVRVLEFVRPKGGMFIWLTIPFESHPLAQSSSSSSSKHVVQPMPPPLLSHALWLYLTTPAGGKTLLSPGQIFSATQDIRENRGWKHFRVCFAAIPAESVEDVSARVVRGLHGFWSLKREEVDALLKEEEESSSVGEGCDGLAGWC